MWLKWLIDRVGAFIILLILFPLLLAIAVAIKVRMPGPIFYRQVRSGKNAKPFSILKFRTMIVGAEHMGLGMITEKNDARIPPLGNFLRRWSLDELPQLWNVLVGDMSLIGPRPTIPAQVAEYTDRQRRRLEMWPGISGWAQVNGRNELSWPERIEHDIWYIDHWSLWLDIRIVFRTFGVLLKGDDVYASDVKKFEIRGK